MMSTPFGDMGSSMTLFGFSTLIVTLGAHMRTPSGLQPLHQDSRPSPKQMRRAPERHPYHVSLGSSVARVNLKHLRGSPSVGCNVNQLRRVVLVQWCLTQ